MAGLENTKDLKMPTNELIDEYITKFESNEKDYLVDEAIKQLFNQFPRNKDIKDILLKVIAINTLYSTNILDVYKMAGHIQQSQIDESLKNGNLAIVEQIATKHGISKSTGGNINFYSFATKYCGWHNQEYYPIFDYFVEKILIAYRDKYAFSEFSNADLKDYQRFKKILEDFTNYFQLTQYNFKKIDKFLWMHGKEIFPRNYKAKDKINDDN